MAKGSEWQNLMPFPKLLSFYSQISLPVKGLQILLAISEAMGPSAVRGNGTTSFGVCSGEPMSEAWAAAPRDDISPVPRFTEFSRAVCQRAVSQEYRPRDVLTHYGTTDPKADLLPAPNPIDGPRP